MEIFHSDFLNSLWLPVSGGLSIKKRIEGQVDAYYIPIRIDGKKHIKVVVSQFKLIPGMCKGAQECVSTVNEVGAKCILRGLQKQQHF